MAVEKCAAWLRRRQEDEQGAELVEFAVVIVLLLMIVYGMVAVGLSLAARESINQAVADGARYGSVQPLDTNGNVTTATETAADNKAANELGWLGLGACGGGKVVCNTGVTSCPTSFTGTGTSGDMCVSASTGTGSACNSSSGIPTQTCLTVSVNYYYTSAPIFPLLPGFNLITPSDITSSATMQVSTPT
jgi:Flp pilus assembly protein TadG